MVEGRRKLITDKRQLGLGLLIGLVMGIAIYYVLNLVNETAKTSVNAITYGQLGTYCVSETGGMLSLEEAIGIAEKSDCAGTGILTSDYSCNPVTGTWWINMNVAGKPNCSPACVVYVGLRTADVNWRCTGLAQS